AVILFASIIGIERIQHSAKILVQKDTQYGSLWIFDDKNSRCLSFKPPPTDIVQSCEFLEEHHKIAHNYTKMFLGALFINDNPKNILVVGLGGGNIQKALNFLLPNAQIDTVEINPALPELVEKYFDYKEDEHNKFYIQDAAEFVLNAPSNSYDVVFIDAFGSEYIPPHLLTDKFMSNVKRILKPGGVVAMNTFTSSKTYEQEGGLIKKEFGKFYNLIVGGTRVVITMKGAFIELNEIQSKANLWLYKFAHLDVNIKTLYDLFVEQK
ncbi:MAG: fused MFS/spermidine synthase, partial [Proteobacteria bacterium]|nr:fused MFS/spermidine synthase [Pseudomonadota bacterium]